MANYGLVAESINRLSDRIANQSERDRAHERTVADIGLQNASLDLKANVAKGQNQLAIAQTQREQYLDEPVSFGIAIQTSKLPDEQKARILQSMPKDIQDFPTTRRKALDAYRTITSERAASQERQKLAQLGLDATAKEGSLNRASRERIAQMGLDAAREKAPNTAAQKYSDNVNLQNLMGKYGISTGIDGNIQSPDLTPQQAQMIQNEARQMGLNVYFDSGEVTDTGSGWNPFDNKKVQVYKVRSIAPSRGVAQNSLGLSESPLQTANQPAPQQNKSEAGQLISKYLSGSQGKSVSSVIQQQERPKVQTFESYAQENPEDASKSGLDILIDRLKNTSESDKQKAIERKKRRDAGTFLRQGPR